MAEQLFDYGPPDANEVIDVAESSVLDPEVIPDDLGDGEPISTEIVEDAPIEELSESAPDEPVAAAFTPIVVDGFGIEEDVKIESEEQLREILADHNNNKAWKRANQEYAEELGRVAETIKPYYNLMERYKQLPPMEAAVFNDVMVNGVPLEQAIQRANIQYQNAPDSLPDPNDDLAGYLQGIVSKEFNKIKGSLAPPVNNQVQQPAQQQPTQAQQEISNASGTALEQVRAEWQAKFGPEGQKIPGFDFSGDNARSWQIAAKAINRVLVEKKLNPHTQVITNKVWNEVLEAALPKLSIAAKRAAAAPQRVKQTAQIRGKVPSAGKQGQGIGGRKNWFAPLV